MRYGGEPSPFFAPLLRRKPDEEFGELRIDGHDGGDHRLWRGKEDVAVQHVMTSRSSIELGLVFGIEPPNTRGDQANAR